MKFLILVAIFYSINGQAQHTMKWVSGLGGSEEDYSSKIVTDQKANVYGTGFFQDTIGSLAAYGFRDVLVYKYHSNGVLSWLLGLGGPGDDVGNDISIDDNGNLYVTGFYRNGNLYYNNDSLLNIGKSDAFVAKIDSLGTVLWCKNIGGQGNEIGTAIDCDNNGNIYVAGTFEDSLTIDGQSLQNYGGYNNFIIKLNSSGALIWHQTLSTPTLDNIQDVEVDSLGNLFLTGFFRDILYGSLGQLYSYNGTDALLAKFDTNGNLDWWKNIGSSLSSFAFAVHLDYPNMYITGMFDDSIFFDNEQIKTDGEFDAFVAQFDWSGNSNWVSTIQGGDDSKAFDVATMTNGNVCAVGYFDGVARVGSDSIVSRNPRHDPSDVFIAEFFANGSPYSFNRIGGVLTDYATGISILDTNHIYISGIYADSVNFDSTLMLSNAASSDVFVVQYAKESKTATNKIGTNKIQARVYPNPATNIVNLEFELLTTENVEVFLYNSIGQPIKNIMARKSCIGKQALSFGIHKWAAGIYYIQIRTRNQDFLLPFVVAN